MYSRMTFQLNTDDAATLARLSAQYHVSMAQIARESLRRLLDDLPAYEQTRQQQLVERHPLPADEQRANFERYMVEHAAIDLDALFASLPPPPDTIDF